MPLMTDARSIPDAVQWHEGMLLSPQHFQQADLRAHALQCYMMLAAAPFGWGVRRLQIDEAALVAGKFAVTDLEAIMPDGLLVLHSNDPAPSAPKLELDLLPLLADVNARRIAVHVTVAVQSSLALRTGEQQRFRQVHGAEVVDENTGDNAIPIPRLVPRLTLQWTDGPLRPPPPRFVSLPLVVLESDGQRFNIVDYEPPRFRVEHDMPLAKLAGKVAAALSGKASDWGLRLSAALAEGQANTVGDSQATLRNIVRGLPHLEALLKIEVAHPFDVYLSLCGIAGDLAVVTGQLTLPVFGAYAHADPLAAFETVKTFINDALDKLRTPHTSVAFDHPVPGRFELLLQPEYPLPARHTVDPHGALVIGARIGPGEDAAFVRAWFDAAVIGSASRIETMLNNAVIGARRDAIVNEPTLDLIPPPNMLLFRVAADPAFIAVGETLLISQLAVEGQAEPVELRLFLAAADAAAPTGRP
jgi:type VI secretion system protein ImpJ